MNWNFNSPVIIQGISQERVIELADRLKLEKDNTIVGIIAGQKSDSTNKIPIFDLVEEAIQAVGEITTSLIFVTAERVLDAGLEAIASGIKQLIILTPNVPPLDIIQLLKIAKANHVLVLGSGSSGIIIPKNLCFGTLQKEYFQSGNVGIIGYGESLIYEIAWELNKAKIGQSIAVSLGTDKIIGSNLIQWLEILDKDDSTAVIILIQSSQDIDYQSIESIVKATEKPVICYIAGSQTPVEQIFRESVAIINNNLSNSIPATNSYRKTINTLKKSKIPVAHNPSEIPLLIDSLLTTKKERSN